MKLFFLFFLFFFSSCTSHYIQVQTQFLTEDRLAKTFVNTPDPLLETNASGQRLLIEWNLSSPLPLSLELQTLNYLNEKKKIFFPSIPLKGTIVYDLVGDDYFCSKGIFSYCVEIKSEEEIIACWKHPLWVDIIEFNKK